MADDLKIACDPFDLFDKWFSEAKKMEPSDPNAAALSTANSAGEPNVRMVLIKHFDQQGFVFYTNLKSVKGCELTDNPYAALCFHWKSVERQVRIKGAVVPVTAKEADAYFASRHKSSQIGAWASKQSQVLENRFALEKAIAFYAAKYAMSDIPRPEHWSGFRVVPASMEFWQAKKFRLHDRVQFQKQGDTTWSKKLLYP